MAKTARAALFMDYENFYTTLQMRFQAQGHAGTADFLALVDFIAEQFGVLSQVDFIAVANFSHYDRQKGGLNQVATLVAVDSFEARPLRSREQPSPGKKYVVKDYADMRLAFEVGRHCALHPADITILASGDKSFAAVGQALRERGFPVVFLLAWPDQTAMLIKDQFTWVDFMASQKEPPPVPAPLESESPAVQDTPVDRLCAWISTLRQEFRTAVPAALAQAPFGTQEGARLLQAAQSQGRLDLWDDPSGTACVSLREERMFNKVVPMSVRPDFLVRASLLLAVVRTAEGGLKEPTRAEWRRALQKQGSMSVRQAKDLLNELLESGILQDGSLERLHLPPEKTLDFLRGSAG